jgi:hypothetical protein
LSVDAQAEVASCLFISWWFQTLFAFVLLSLLSLLFQLNYSTHTLLPFNHYGRKNLGYLLPSISLDILLNFSSFPFVRYLYSIQHGAKIIYDTDDDSLLFTSTVEQIPNSQSRGEEKIQVFSKSGSLFLNVLRRTCVSFASCFSDLEVSCALSTPTPRLDRFLLFFLSLF